MRSRAMHASGIRRKSGRRPNLANRDLLALVVQTHKGKPRAAMADALIAEHRRKFGRPIKKATALRRIHEYRRANRAT